MIENYLFNAVTYDAVLKPGNEIGRSARRNF
jgi:hypothetical protein